MFGDAFTVALAGPAEHVVLRIVDIGAERGLGDRVGCAGGGGGEAEQHLGVAVILDQDLFLADPARQVGPVLAVQFMADPAGFPDVDATGADQKFGLRAAVDLDQMQAALLLADQFKDDGKRDAARW